MVAPLSPVAATRPPGICARRLEGGRRRYSNLGSINGRRRARQGSGTAPYEPLPARQHRGKQERMFDGALAAFLASAHECGKQERLLDDALARLLTAAHERGEQERMLDDAFARLPAPAHERGEQERMEKLLFALSFGRLGPLGPLRGRCHEPSFNGRPRADELSAA